jgi:type IV secretory pathway VirJ component
MPLRRRTVVLGCALLLATSAVAAPRRPVRTWDERTISLPLVGRVVAYVPGAPTSHVVLLVGGHDRWAGVDIQVARRIVAQQAIVVGIPYGALKRYAVKDSWCWFVASDFELLSHAAQKALRLSQYQTPVLVGYQTGAALVYAALANTPAVTFDGGISLAFCPTVTIDREICSSDTWTPDHEAGRSNLPAARTLPKDWYVLQGADDRVCSIDATRRFLAGTPRTHLVSLDGTGHAFSTESTWGPALDRALRELWTPHDIQPPAAQPRSASMRELEDELQRLQLPFEFRWPAQLSSLLLFFSGDGGWASLDDAVSEQLTSHGVGVIGVSSLRYFWNRKSPAQVAADIRRIVAILARSGRPVFVGGYSFGAEVSPVAVAQWPPGERRMLTGLVLIAPGTSASFEIDPLDWIRTPAENPATRVAPAIHEDALPVVCVAGTDEDDSPCGSLAGLQASRIVRLPGAHHFNGDYAAVANAVASFIRATSPGRQP